MEVARALHVHGEPVRSRVGEGLEIATGLRDHEMRLERKAGHPTKRADDDRADRDVRHEVPVHDVDVNPVRPAASASATSSPRRAKSAERMEGARAIRCVTEDRLAGRSRAP